MAASADSLKVYASDIFRDAWYTVNSTGVLTLAVSTAANSIVPATDGFMMVDRSGKYPYTRACDPKAPPPGCSEVLWGGTIGSDGSVTPIRGTPFPVQLFQFDLVY
jgi:hypothetical protein